MAYPEQIGGRRDFTQLQAGLAQWAREFDTFIKHTATLAKAYAGVTAADFVAGGATAGQAAALAALVAGLANVPSAPAIVQIGNAADTVREIGS